MLSEYIEKQFKKAKFKALKDGSYFGSVSDFPGAWANRKTLALCKKELREVLEESPLV
ncbi:MAG TPA: type II toxin-antitoxin system HicB family antitoxin [Candidatus Paceibacterota bacterium]